MKTLTFKTANTIVNFLDLATTPLEPMQVKRKIVTVRTFINRLMRTPQRIENVELRPIIVETDYEVEHKGEMIQQTYTSKLGGTINVRIETYKNKQVVKVFANIDERFLRSI